jgi:ribonuclease VapC
VIVDTSVLVTLIREEAATARFIPVLNRNVGKLKMSTASYLEAGIVIDANDDPVVSAKLDEIVRLFEIELVPVSAFHARTAREGYRTFGKGRHPAKLNFGDCFAYALARATGEPLMFKGDDFSLTDVEDAAPRP